MSAPTVVTPMVPAVADINFKWRVVDRALGMLGDLMVVGIFVLAVSLGLLDRNAAVAMVGYGLRSIVDPSIVLGKVGFPYGTGSATGQGSAA